MKKSTRKIFKVLLYPVGGILVIISGLTFTLWIKSPGKADPILNSNGKIQTGSISTIEEVTLGGQEQYLIIRGADSTKPVMLFLHGGPGHPELAFMKNANQAIEKDFVMVYWEQRGAGKSFSKHIPAESMNLAQFISDTRELSQILAKRFKQEKIYVMGHSWGSLLGILTVHQYPELFHAYLGVGQIGHLYKSEQLSFNWVKDQAVKRNNKEALKALTELSYPDSLASWDTWLKFLMVERKYVTQFGGGLTHKITAEMWPVTKMMLAAKEYTLSEKMEFLTGSMYFSVYHLFLEVLNKNLLNDIDSLQVPVYIFQGKHDYQTAYLIAKDFYDQLKAPHKEFFTFENSAHSPNIEEVDKFNSLVKEKTRTPNNANK